MRKIREIGHRVRRRLPSGASVSGSMWDAAFLAGSVAVGWGLWRIYPPLALIAGGLFIMLIAWVFGTTGAPRRRRVR